MYKATKDQVSVFGLQTQFGGGKTTGFGLIYDSPEAMKKFEPRHRLVRVGMATKIERASRQQRRWPLEELDGRCSGWQLDGRLTWHSQYRQAAQEPTEDSAGYSKGQGCQVEEGEISLRQSHCLAALEDAFGGFLFLLLRWASTKDVRTIRVHGQYIVIRDIKTGACGGSGLASAHKVASIKASRIFT